MEKRILFVSSTRFPWFESQDSEEHFRHAPYSIGAIGYNLEKLGWTVGWNGWSSAKSIRALSRRIDEYGVIWNELTVELFRLMGLKRTVQRCTTAEFPRPAPRPANSALAKTVLNKHGYHTPRWQDALAGFVQAEFPGS